MSEPGERDTSVSLFERLRDDRSREVAWAEFVDRYGRLIYRWCQRWGLQASDAEDVTQETLLTLVRLIAEFRYDPSRSFRSYMKSIAHSVWYHTNQKRSTRLATAGGSAALEALASTVARDDLAERFEALAWRELYQQAFDRVKGRVAAQTWSAFERSALEHQPLAEVARQLGVRIEQVYAARNRVQSLLREEIQLLDPEP